MFTLSVVLKATPEETGIDTARAFDDAMTALEEVGWCERKDARRTGGGVIVTELECEGDTAEVLVVGGAA